MSKKIEILIVGVGSIGERHLRCFQNTGRTKVSLCEVNSSLREQVAQKYGIDQAYADLDSAIENPPHAAVVATPAHLHTAIACQLAETGIHLLIEKPLSTTWAGIEAMCNLVEQKQLLAAVAYVYRSHPALAAMKQAIDSGRFGKPLQLVAVAGQHFPTYRPAYRDTYYNDRSKGGGVIQDALTHVVNAGEWLVGPTDRVVVDAAHLALEGVQVEDTVNVLARHGDVLASYSMNQHQAPNELAITVICTEGAAQFEMHRNRWRWMVDVGGEWQNETSDIPERDSWFTLQANNFLDALEGIAPPACVLAAGVQTLRCNLAMLESVEKGTWQSCRDAK